LLSASIKLRKHNNAANKLESLFLVMYQITFVLFNLEDRSVAHQHLAYNKLTLNLN
jgi:hypothetical protein